MGGVPPRPYSCRHPARFIAQKNTRDSLKRSRGQDQARGGGPVNPQEVSTGRPTPRPTHKNAKSKPRAGNRGATSYRQRAEASGSGRPGMLINVDMLPAMNLTKPYFQTSIRGPRQPYRQTLEQNSRGQTGGRGLICSRKNNFLQKFCRYTPPRGPQSRQDPGPMQAQRKNRPGEPGRPCSK